MSLKIIKEVRDINRFREILAVLFEEGFDFVVDKIREKHSIPLTRKLKQRLDEKRSHPMEKRLRLTLERLGPTFIKFGQMLSVRPDLIPKSYIKELEKLQDSVPSFPFEQVQQTIRHEFRKDIKDIFKEFDQKPIASASISQVHKAVLKDGSTVAVKIQRPDVDRLIETDIEIMKYIASLLESHFPAIRKYEPLNVVNEFAKWTLKELDFRREAANCHLFEHNFKNIPTVKIPAVYENLISNKALVFEFIDGVELHNIEELRKRKIDLGRVMKNGFDAALTQVFIHGFFHADPHPGNILVMPDCSIALVDFGIVGHFDDRLKEKSISLFYGVIENDADMIVDTLVEICDSSSEVDKRELKYEVRLILDPLQSRAIKDIKISHILESVMDIALNFGLKMPLSFVLFGKTIVTLEGIALEYDPDFRIVDASKPFVEKLMKERTSPQYIAKSIIKSAFRFRKLLEVIPEETERVLRKIEKGTIKVDIPDSSIRKLSVEIDRSSNRVSYAMIIAALLIVGAILMQLNKGPIIFQMPILSFLSFIGAGILAIILFFSIIKEAGGG